MKFFKKLKEKWKLVELVFAGMAKDHVSEFAAQCSYYTILSFIPFLILLLTLIQYTGIDKNFLLETLSRLIPASMNEVVIRYCTRGIFEIVRNDFDFYYFYNLVSRESGSLL